MARKRTTKKVSRVPKEDSHKKTKSQGYTFPLELWQDLVGEAARRKALGLEYPTQNAIAVEAIASWLETNKGKGR